MNPGKTEIRQQLNELRKKQVEAHKKLRELEPASSQAWSDLKSGIDAAMDDLEKAFKQIRSRFQ